MQSVSEFRGLSTISVGSWFGSCCCCSHVSFHLLSEAAMASPHSSRCWWLLARCLVAAATVDANNISLALSPPPSPPPPSPPTLCQSLWGRQNVATLGVDWCNEVLINVTGGCDDYWHVNENNRFRLCSSDSTTGFCERGVSFDCYPEPPPASPPTAPPQPPQPPSAPPQPDTCDTLIGRNNSRAASPQKFCYQISSPSKCVNSYYIKGNAQTYYACVFADNACEKGEPLTNCERCSELTGRMDTRATSDLCTTCSGCDTTPSVCESYYQGDDGGSRSLQLCRWTGKDGAPCQPSLGFF